MEIFFRLYNDIFNPLRSVYEYGLSNGWIYVGFSLATFASLAIIMSIISIMIRLEQKPTPPISEICWIIGDEIFEKMGLWLLLVSAIWPIGVLFIILFVVLFVINIPRFCLRLAYLYSLKAPR